MKNQNQNQACALCGFLCVCSLKLGSSLGKYSSHDIHSETPHPECTPPSPPPLQLQLQLQPQTVSQTRKPEVAGISEACSHSQSWRTVKVSNTGPAYTRQPKMGSSQTGYLTSEVWVRSTVWGGCSSPVTGLLKSPGYLLRGYTTPPPPPYPPNPPKQHPPSSTQFQFNLFV